MNIQNSHQIASDSENGGTNPDTCLFASAHSESLQDNAIRLARRIPLGKHTPEKCEAVHSWHKAVKDMLKGDC